ncbi:MAG: SDR family NAD(P)-dependent oxidoreductase [Candidatus Saganbacteria bacterium]|nr:SDR family NAD(P)-dependent oxidoreductase [Candidatus Saganbacteria bacterium]
MVKDIKKVVIVSISSDIGSAMAERFLDRGWKIFGTYRNNNPQIALLKKQGVSMCYCDLNKALSVKAAAKKIKSTLGKWDLLVICAGEIAPIGPFMETDFDAWEASLAVNFSSQMRMVRTLLPDRSLKSENGPCVLFFAGGGTNNATQNYSAYTVSKIALIKMCELLDAEIPDTRFSIIGPGWVKTKIHAATLKAGKKAGENYIRTLARFEQGDFVSMEKVLDCCDWVISSPRQLVGGRNFSAVFDQWGKKELAELLRKNPNLYKLRRFGNDWLAPDQKRRKK